MPHEMQQAVEALRDAHASRQKLRRADFSLTNGTPNQRSRIARFRAENPVVLTSKAMRLMFIVQETVQTNATAADTETFNLANNIIKSANTADFVLYENGARVQPDSVDYANDSFTYTDDGTGNQLHAFYVARNPVNIEIEVSAPKKQGSASHVVYDDVSALLHERNQNKEPPRMEFDDPGAAPSKQAGLARILERVIPPDWTLDVYQDGPIGFDWDDSDATNSDGTTATNALLTIPVRRGRRRIPGLSKAKARSILEG